MGSTHSKGVKVYEELEEQDRERKARGRHHLQFEDDGVGGREEGNESIQEGLGWMKPRYLAPVISLKLIRPRSGVTASKRTSAISRDILS